MELLLAAIEATGPAQYLRVSRLGYAAVSGAHILGIAFSRRRRSAAQFTSSRILALDLLRKFVRVLVPVAATASSSPH